MCVSECKVRGRNVEGRWFSDCILHSNYEKREIHRYNAKYEVVTTAAMNNTGV
jgi:hypothetical protein